MALDGSRRSNVVNLEHFVPVVVDHFDRHLARGRRLEGVARGAVEGRPLGLVDLGSEGSLELAVRVIGPEEVGVPDEETLAVVIRVDEPTGDVAGR